MLEFFRLLGGSLLLRPYVYAFLLCYLILAVRYLGGRRTLLFTIVCWAVAFLSEYASTRCGFPYGLYHYIDTTRNQELWLSNVPFFDSLSYTFLQYFSFTTARALLGNRKIHWAKLAALSALLVMLLDMVMDPVANQGEKWFLGKIYFYPNGGAHFGVPISNYFGWFLVGWVSVALFLFGEKKMAPRSWDQRQFAIPGGDGWNIFMYYSVWVFSLGVTLYIGEFRLFAAGLLIVVPFSVVTYLRLGTLKRLRRQRLRQQP